MTSYLCKDRLVQFFPKIGSRKTADTEYTKEQFIKALDRFNEILKTMNQKMTFLCVGGGSMMLHLGIRNSTHDLDGMLDNSNLEGLFHEVASQVAGELKLAPDWINIQVKPILKAQQIKASDFESSSKFNYSNLKLLFAKPGLMLGLKCHALRKGKKDFQDVVNLLKILNIKTIEALEAEVSKYVDWSYIGNDEVPLLKLSISWAFPGSTEYEPIRQEALRRYQEAKSKR